MKFWLFLPIFITFFIKLLPKNFGDKKYAVVAKITGYTYVVYVIIVAMLKIAKNK